MVILFNSLNFARLNFAHLFRCVAYHVILRHLSETATVKMPIAPTLKLNDGNEIPAIAFGTYDPNTIPGELEEALGWGIDAGFRHIDTATAYHNEKDVGKGIAKKVADGTVTRDELFITAKLWNDKHAPNDVIPTLKESLRKLQLDYVNLYLMHWPVSVTRNKEDAKIDYLETWAAMEEAQKLGLTRSIGVSNFNEKQLERLLKEGTIKPVVNQIEVHPTLTQEPLVKFCQSRNVVTAAYSSFGHMSEFRRTPNSGPPGMDDPFFVSLAKKYGKIVPQVVLRYSLDRGNVVVAKTFMKNRIEENIDIFDFQLTPEEVEQINKFDNNERIIVFPQYQNMDNYPF